MQKLGIMGGTFNPVHTGHLIAAQEVASKLKLDKILFIPAGDPPHKNRNSIAAASDRLKMVELAISENGLFEASDMEINREGRTYTFDTLTELKKIYNSEIYFIIGYDTLVDMDTWKNVSSVFKLAYFVVVNRGNHDIEMNREIVRKQNIYNAKFIVVDIPDIQISSTAIREKVKSGSSIKYLVPNTVEEYILSKGLYTDGL